MKSITRKTALLGIASWMVLSTGSSQCADGLTERFTLPALYSWRGYTCMPYLPRVSSLPQLEEFNRLPYPRNYIAAHRELSQHQREELEKYLGRVEKSIFQDCRTVTGKAFPLDVLSFAERQLWTNRRRSAFREFKDILQQHPELITHPFSTPVVVSSDATLRLRASEIQNMLDAPTDDTTTLARIALHYPAMGISASGQRGDTSGFLERLLDAGFDPRQELLAPCYPNEGQVPFLKLPNSSFLFTYLARNAAVKAKQHEQFVAALKECTDAELGSDIAKLILDFTPLNAVGAVQKYREGGKSLLDTELERLAQLDQSNASNAREIHQRTRTINILIQCGVPAIKHPELLEQYTQQTQEKRWPRWKRTAAIASTCVAAISGLAYWWFNKK